MTPNHAEILSAFFDGESVDPQLLAEGLQEPDATQFLVECARLRKSVQGDDSMPGEEVSARLRGIVAQGDRARMWRRRVVQVSMAASLAFAAAAGGFGVRSWMDRRSPAPVATVPVQQANQPQPRGAGENTPAPVPATTAPDSERRAPHPIPSPGLRMHFDEWRNSAL